MSSLGVDWRFFSRWRPREDFDLTKAGAGFCDSAVSLRVGAILIYWTAYLISLPNQQPCRLLSKFCILRLGLVIIIYESLQLNWLLILLTFYFLTWPILACQYFGLFLTSFYHDYFSDGIYNPLEILNLWTRFYWKLNRLVNLSISIS